jgi:iron complex transport system ATP-binding protein
MPDPLLELRDVSLWYGASRVLDRVSVSFEKGRVIALLGENGSGKSTVLKILAGLLSPNLGSVLLEGRELQKVSRSEAACRIGYLPQAFEPFFPARVREVAVLGRIPHLRGFASAGPADYRAADEALEEADVLPLSCRNIQQLSGGERQRVLLARVLAGQPEIFLLDEPTSNLDPRHRLKVASIMRRRADAGGLVVVPTHELDLAVQVADEAVLMKEGRVLAAGPLRTVLTSANLEQVFGVKARVFTGPEGLEHVALFLEGTEG